MSQITTILFLFYGTLIALLIIGLRVEFTATPKETSSLETSESETNKGSLTQFKNAFYFVTKEYRPYLFLKAKTIDYFSNQDLAYFSYPKGDAYKEDGSIVHYKAIKGKVEAKEENLFLYQDVWLFDDTTTIQSNEASYNKKEDFFVVKGDVKSEHLDLKTKDQIFITANRGNAWPKQKIAHYEGNVEGSIIRHRAYEPQTDFEGDLLKMDSNRSHVELIGNVAIFRATVTAYSRRGEIFLENYNKNLKYYALYDDVKIHEKYQEGGNGRWLERQAFSEKLEGLAKEGKIILTGYPRLIQGNDTVKGNVITFYEQSDIIEVDDSHSNLMIKGK